ncbi:MAG: TIGR00730 family Rossman fold protein [Oscillospiraceae bacterium]|nr:TIGR00730 family Rossman fold protein [Oscillospiraceae bacterium]
MEELKKYFDKGFLKDDERGFRIFKEFVEIKEQMLCNDIKNTIVMFGSARIKPDDSNEKARKYYWAARDLAYRLASWVKENCPLEDKYFIATGGGVGIMEAANRGAAEAGEPTIGLNIRLPFEQAENPYIPSELVFMFHYFFIRKFYFAYPAKAFVIFPGGFGTLDELFEILTLAQTHKMHKTMPFVIFGKEFFSKILNMDMLLEHGLISQSDRDLFILTDDIDEAFDHITSNIKPARCILDR